MNNTGKKVTINCEGWFIDNQGDKIVFDSTYEKVPVSFVVGDGSVIPGIDEAVAEMNIGETKSFVFPPEKAFGLYDNEKTNTYPLTTFENSGIIKLGQFLPFEDTEGNRHVGQVLKITDTDFVFDLNHPFAGKTINYTIELLSVE